MALQGWGTAFGAFETYEWYDVIVHFMLSAWTAPLLYLALARLSVVPDLAGRSPRRHRAGIFVVTFALGLATGALFEIYEWIVNHLFGATLFVSYGDTIGDLAMDAAGAAAGGLLLVVWETFGWGTARRVPGTRIEGT